MMVTEITKEEVAHSFRRYKASTKFEEEVWEAICDAFMKGFEECKRKMAQLFHLPDLHDIMPIDLDDDPDGTVPPAEAAPVLPAIPDQAESI